MAISDSDTKILWGRAAGTCSNPECRTDLTALLLNGVSYNIGEMAHIIARSEKGPRGEMGAGPDTYDNLVLLCPTCHRKIDKAPAGAFPEEMIRRWKSQHEQIIGNIGRTEKYERKSDLKRRIRRILQENHAIWREYGPHSKIALSDPGSNLYQHWNMLKLAKILPNNSLIKNILRGNLDLLTDDEFRILLEFENHASGFESNQYGRLDSYPLFPVEFERIFDE